MQTLKEKVDKACLGKIIPRHDEKGHHYEFVDKSLVVDSVTTILSILGKDHLSRWMVTKGVEWLEKGERWIGLSDPERRKELIVGAQTAYTDIRDDAGNVGTQAHNAIEKYLLAWIESGVRPDDIRLFFPCVYSEKDIPTFIDGILIERKSIKISDSLWIVDTDARAIASARAVERLFQEHNVVPLYSELLVGDPKFSAGTLDFLCLWDGKLTLVDWKTSNHVDQVSYSLQIAAYKYFFQKMTGIRIKQCKLIHLSKDNASYSIYNLIKDFDCYKAFKSLCNVYKWKNGNDGCLLKDKKILKI